jgi:hypothetical protein
MIHYAYEDRRDPHRQRAVLTPAEVYRRALAAGRERPAVAPSPGPRPNPTPTRRVPMPTTPARPVPSMRVLDNEVTILRASRPARRPPAGAMIGNNARRDRAARLEAAERAVGAERQRAGLHRLVPLLEARA